MAKKTDEEFYLCRAENPVGYTNASASLRVLGTNEAKTRCH